MQNTHGVPGGTYTYHSRRFGDIDLKIPQHPDVEEGRKLFAHYLWNAAVIAAQGIERASFDDAEAGNQALPPHEQSEENNDEDGEEKKEGAAEWKWQRKYWDVRGKTVAELGAGTALPSIIAALSGALSVTITDHPSSPALTTGAIEQNVQRNIVERLGPPEAEAAVADSGTSTAPTTSRSPATVRMSKSDSAVVVNVYGYTWGTTTMYLPSHYGKPAPGRQSQRGSDRIILADCLWMPSQHVNLVKTIFHCLRPEQEEPLESSASHGADQSCALVVAGFHTGREIVRHFFEVATGDYRIPSPPPSSSEIDARDIDRYGKKDESACLRAAEIFETDVNGLRRPWEPSRPGETEGQAKRWCVVAVLVRR
ncbi:uncharacterized protein Z520_06131 [Fonsecaea multimorphosa CBS 102226]|uniref:Nicotinamide N-methyltransferase n=1 Tax=Fonsecaea multimorphosa CBS 102226 TaxID=1442371 RepID=A0A0D2JWU9_9EURO|nr:uncharacterized protein Z520_06131 [Fonsecaea multimorphosa CBS 102226]KIX98052.1 hypothetical protein Z520_06131 [Fonsecaea multimorphosa CBS 102226]